MPESAATSPATTVADLIQYLEQFIPELEVFLDIEAAVQAGYAEDYVEAAYVSLSYALGKLEDRPDEFNGTEVQHNNTSKGTP
jgi:hypothetical protein